MFIQYWIHCRATREGIGRFLVFVTASVFGGTVGMPTGAATHSRQRRMPWMYVWYKVIAVQPPMQSREAKYSTTPPAAGHIIVDGVYWRDVDCPTSHLSEAHQ